MTLLSSSFDISRFGVATASAELGRVVTRRQESLFASDVLANDKLLRDRISGKRILVVGGGGTIGSSTTKLLCRYEPKAVCIVDISENYLVELVRTLRGQPEGLGDIELQTFAIDYGSSIMARMLSNVSPFDVVLNFAALKHVRSEKDVYSLLQMLNTNVVAHVRFKETLARYGHGAAYFAVSTDKAANPSSLMGASKRLMENVAFDVASNGSETTTSTRFANVAFSNGSLLQGMLQRLAKGQPVAVPKDTKRYFVTEEESGELCLIAALLGPNQHVVFPRLDAENELQPLQDIAERILGVMGFEAELFNDEEEARRAVSRLAPLRKWPLLLTPLDTSGEKPFEEFVGRDEAEVALSMSSVLAVRHRPSTVGQSAFMSNLEAILRVSEGPLDKDAIVQAIGAVLPTLSHKETGRSLDDRL